MIKSEIVIDQHYKDFSPMQFGSETCDPGHFFGPSVRTHWLLHYIVYGFGRFERDGISYSVKLGDIFVIPPYEKTYYEADQKKPWRYIWIGFTTDLSTFPKEVRHTRTEMKLRMRPDIAGFAPFFLVEKVDSYITAP